MSFLYEFKESQLEEAAIELLINLGYKYVPGYKISPDEMFKERDDYKEVLLKNTLLQSLYRINGHLHSDAIEEVYRKITFFNSNSIEENNKEFHKMLTEGVDVTYNKDGVIRTEKAYIIDFNNIDNNTFLVVNQFTILGKEERRPDIILFVNGIPLVVIELKSAADENVGIENAYNQIQTYKKDIPDLFFYNAFCIITDGINAKVGTITSNFERFMNWRSIDGQNIESLNIPQYEVIIKGMLNKERLFDIIENFILFKTSKEIEYDKNANQIGTRKAVNKILAAYHQYFAVKKAIEKTKIAISSKGDKKIGVIWHTQGSGKSFTMVFYAAQLVKHFNNPTIVVISDRNDLDDQLYSTFCDSYEILRQMPIQADVRKANDQQKELNGLFDLLNQRQSGGIIFTTIQKFKPEEGDMPVLTDRKNVIVIADEAHRSQYGLEAKTDSKTGEVKYGFAKYVRDALPNASFIGFTGTPIELGDRSTPLVFGDYIDIYDMTRAVEDGTTVKIYYENRIIKLETNDEELTKIDDEFEEITEGQEEIEKEKNKSKWSRLEAVVGSPNRIKKLAEDIVNHYEEKSKTIDGKAMIVCMSRRICVDLYNQIVALRPDWHSDDVNKGKIKVVITGGAGDNEKLQKHIGGKQRRDILAKRMKDPDDELKIVIVRDMWLTGFDVPCLHTMYIDKPMKGHNLMQAIARVNRVFRDKPGGVIVDYLGIFECLKEALRQYTPSDRKNIAIDTSVAISVMMEKLELICDIFHGFDYSNFFKPSQVEKIRTITEGMNFILGKDENEQKEFKKLVTELAKAHSLCSATEQGMLVNVEVSYFKAVKASLSKLEMRNTTKVSKAEIEARVKQMLQRSIISEEVIDVFDTLGLNKPDISIFSEEFLQEIREIKYKNLAVEILTKLLQGNIKVMGKKNLVKSERFSEKLKKTILKYKNQAITNLEVIEELIALAHEIESEQNKEKELGLSEDEIAFYSALTKHEGIKKFMTDDVLKKIAQDLTVEIKKNITIDWFKRESVRARMRLIVKKLLNKYNYPPKEIPEALDTVLKQAEIMCENEIEDISEFQSNEFEKAAEQERDLFDF